MKYERSFFEQMLLNLEKSMASLMEEWTSTPPNERSGLIHPYESELAMRMLSLRGILSSCPDEMIEEPYWHASEKAMRESFMVLPSLATTPPRKWCEPITTTEQDEMLKNLNLKRFKKMSDKEYWESRGECSVKKGKK